MKAVLALTTTRSHRIIFIQFDRPSSSSSSSSSSSRITRTARTTTSTLCLTRSISTTSASPFAATTDCSVFQLEQPKRGRDQQVHPIVFRSSPHEIKALLDSTTLSNPEKLKRFNDLLRIFLKQQLLRKTDLAYHRELLDAVKLVYSIMWGRVNAELFSPSVITFTMFIELLASRGDSQFLKVWRDMTRLGISPNVITYNVLLKGCIRIASYSMGMEIWFHMNSTWKNARKHTDRSSLDDSSSSSHRDSKSSEDRSRISSTNKPVVHPILPNQWTYTTAIALCRFHPDGPASGFNKGISLFNEMIRAGGLSPSVSTFNAMFQLAFELQDPGSYVMRLYYLMTNLAIEPSQQTFSILINGAKKTADFETANTTFDLLRRQKMFSVRIWNSMLDVVLSLQHDVKAAMQIYEEMRSISQLQPDTDTYSTMLSGLAELGAATQFSRVYEHMVVADIKLSAAIYRSIFKAIGNFHIQLRLNSGGEGSPISLVINNMLDHDIPLSEHSCLIAIQAAIRSGDLDGLVYVFRVLRDIDERNHTSAKRNSAAKQYALTSSICWELDIGFRVFNERHERDLLKQLMEQREITQGPPSVHKVLFAAQQVGNFEIAKWAVNMIARTTSQGAGLQEYSALLQTLLLNVQSPKGRVPKMNPGRALQLLSSIVEECRQKQNFTELDTTIQSTEKEIQDASACSPNPVYQTKS